MPLTRNQKATAARRDHAATRREPARKWARDMERLEDGEVSPEALELPRQTVAGVIEAFEDVLRTDR